MRKLYENLAIYTYPLLCILVLLLGLGIWQAFEDAEREHYQISTIMAALRLVSTIEAYKSETGQLPRSLSELSTDTSGCIAPPRWGNSGWIYRTEGEEFTLKVGYMMTDSKQNLYPEFLYSSSDRIWYLND